MLRLQRLKSEAQAAWQHYRQRNRVRYCVHS